MIAGAQKQLRGTRSVHDAKLKELTKELSELKSRSDRLFEAVESGFLPLDTALQQRSHKLQARRQELLLELAGLKRQNETPLKLLKADQGEAFGKALKSKLAANRPFAKQCLRLLVSRIRVSRDRVKMRGSYEALADAIEQSKRGALATVPSFAPRWLPDLGSNHGPGSTASGNCRCGLDPRIGAWTMLDGSSADHRTQNPFRIPLTLARAERRAPPRSRPVPSRRA